MLIVVNTTRATARIMRSDLCVGEYVEYLAIRKVTYNPRDYKPLHLIIYSNTLSEYRGDTVGREARRSRRTAASCLCPSMPPGGNRLPGTRFFTDRHEAHSLGRGSGHILYGHHAVKTH